MLLKYKLNRRHKPKELPQNGEVYVALVYAESRATVYLINHCPHLNE